MFRFQLARVKRVLAAMPTMLQHNGGLQLTARKAVMIFREEGWQGVRRRLSMATQNAAPIFDEHGRPINRNDYTEWVRRYDTLDDSRRDEILAKIDTMVRHPKISIVMPVYDPPLDFLDQAIWSVRQQLYPHWEFCIADDASKNQAVRDLLARHAAEDPRIKVIYRSENGHISLASNSAAEQATGEFVALLDNDDLLPPQALFYIADAILKNPTAGLIYSDEDKIDSAGNRRSPYFKPRWNPDLFLSHNMICHLGVYRRTLGAELGWFREGYEGAQDYDLALRCVERLASKDIVHIPRVLYHWRSHAGSTAFAGSEKNYASTAGQRALDDHFARIGVAAKSDLLHMGMYRVRYDIAEPAPMVSLIIPTRNGLDLIRLCITSILEKTHYTNYEILIIDNGSDDPNTLAYFRSLANNPNVRVIRDEQPFNYSALNNSAVEQARGEYVALVNNDIEVISPHWLHEMVSIAMQPGVGAVGARLWYPDNRLQHGGVVIGLGGVAGHSHKYLQRHQPGYFHRAQLIQSFSAVTAACLLIKKATFQEVKGLNEEDLQIAFNDVDFCLRVREAGYRNVWTPYAELYHHESATRGTEDTPEKKARFSKEVMYMKERWGDSLLDDPAYSPNLTLDYEDFSLAWPPRVLQ
nr:glycosyltransferase family 2 protein [Candidimonas sp. SYP-B2681]